MATVASPPPTAPERRSAVPLALPPGQTAVIAVEDVKDLELHRAAWEQLAEAAIEPNVTGKWTGSLTVNGPDGQTKDSTALLVLKQAGTEITGTVGPNEDERHAIT